MKKKFNIFVSALLLVLGLGACTKNDGPVHHVNQIKLNSTEPVVLVGKTFQMTAELRPSDAVNQTIVWASEDEQVATISSEGLITGVSVGTARITATIDNVTAEAFANVQEFSLKSLELEQKSAILYLAGEQKTVQLNAVSDPQLDASAFTWTSSKPEVATVENGLVTAVAGGNTVITVSAAGKSATCQVSVVGTEPVIAPDRLEVLNGKTGELKLHLPAALAGKTIVWSSADPDKAVVEAKAEDKTIAVVTAKGYGEVVVKAVVEGKEATATVVIPARVELNLNDYADAPAFEAAVKKFDAQGVTEYVLSGDITKVGFTEAEKGHNAFHEAPNVESIDFSACSGWEKYKTKIILPSIDMNEAAMPSGIGKAFQYDVKANPAPDQYKHLRKLVFSPELKVAGRFFIANIASLEEIIAPGLATLHKESFKDLPSLKKVVLSTPDAFVHGTVSAEYPFMGGDNYLSNLKENCVLHLNSNKNTGDVAETHKFFGIEFKDIVFE